MEKEKLREEVGSIIDRLATIYDEEDIDSSETKKEIEKLGERLKELTGKTIAECEPFRSYWSYTTLDDIVDGILMPLPAPQKLSDDDLRQKLEELYNGIGTYRPDKWDRALKELAVETGLNNLSDYIFYPELVGLDDQATQEECIEKIILDRA